jgi:hypothetical protein
MTTPYLPPVGDVAGSKPTSRDSTRSYLRGTQPLWKAFWIVFVLGSLIVWLLSGVLLSTAMAVSLTPSTGIIFNPIHVASAAALLQGLYFVGAAIAVWRCAPNTPSHLVQYGARVLAMLFLTWWFWRFAFFALFAIPRLYG